MRPPVLKREGRRERKKQEARAALLDAALALFGERGIYATRVEDVTDRADMGKGAFYNYFDSKEAIVGALLQQGSALLDSDYFLPLRAADDLPARIRAVVRAHARFLADRPAYAIVFHQARGLLELHLDGQAPLRVGLEQYLRRVARALFPKFDSDDSTPRAALEAAAVVAGAVAGHRSFALAAGLDASVELVIATLIKGLPGAKLTSGRK
jgi:AcrR family transcriptional regulator